MLSHTGKECGQKCYFRQQAFCKAASVLRHPDLFEAAVRSSGNGEVGQHYANLKSQQQQEDNKAGIAVVICRESRIL